MAIVQRLAVVGAGVMGERYVAAYSDHPFIDVVAVCDTDEQKAIELAAQYGIAGTFSSLADALEAEEIDATVVATPDFAHVQPVLTALEAGCHVLCEKPLATSVEDAYRLYRAVEEAPGQLMVNFGNRHRPSAQRLKSAIEAGEIGEIRYANVLLNEKSVKTNTLSWRDRTSPLWFLLSHVVDLIFWLCDDSAASVAVSRSSSSTEAIGDTTAGLLLMRSGAIALVESSWGMPAGYARDVDLRLRLHGTLSVVELDFGDQGFFVGTESMSRYVLWDMEPKASNSLYDWWNRSCYYFADCISRDIPVRPDAADGLRVVATLEAMQRSIDQSAYVAVEIDEIS